MKVEWYLCMSPDWLRPKLRSFLITHLDEFRLIIWLCKCDSFQVHGLSFSLDCIEALNLVSTGAAPTIGNWQLHIPSLTYGILFWVMMNDWLVRDSSELGLLLRFPVFVSYSARLLHDLLVNIHSVLLLLSLCHLPLPYICFTPQVWEIVGTLVVPARDSHVSLGRCDLLASSLWLALWPMCRCLHFLFVIVSVNDSGCMIQIIVVDAVVLAHWYRYVNVLVGVGGSCVDLDVDIFWLLLRLLCGKRWDNRWATSVVFGWAKLWELQLFMRRRVC